MQGSGEMVFKVSMHNNNYEISQKQNEEIKGNELSLFRQTMEAFNLKEQNEESEEITVKRQEGQYTRSPLYPSSEREFNTGRSHKVTDALDEEEMSDEYLEEVFIQVLRSTSFNSLEYKDARTDFFKGKANSSESLVLLNEMAEYLRKETSGKVLTPQVTEALRSIKKLTLEIRLQGGYFEDSEIILSILKTLQDINDNSGKTSDENPDFLLDVKNTLVLQPLDMESVHEDFNRASDPLPVSFLSRSISHGTLQTFINGPAAGSLHEEFHLIMNQAKFGKADGTEKLLIRLQPEHLGMLKIELIQKEGMLTAKVMTSTGTAKEIIESKIQQLHQAFALQNIKVDKLQVEHVPIVYDQSGDQNTKHSTKQHDDQRHQKQDEAQPDPEHQFNQILLNVEV